MPSTVTQRGHVELAIQFYNYLTKATNGVWVGIGNPSSGSWQSPYSDTSPPIPSSTASLDNPIGYKQVSAINLVYPSQNGTINYQGSNWAISSVSNAFLNNANYVCIQASINYNELPVNVQYREVGIFVGLQPASGASGVALLPSQVSNPGTMILLTYQPPVTRSANEYENLTFIITL